MQASVCPQLLGWLPLGPGTPAREKPGSGCRRGRGWPSSASLEDGPRPHLHLAALVRSPLELAFVLLERDTALLIKNASRVVCTALCHEVVLVEVCGV